MRSKEEELEEIKSYNCVNELTADCKKLCDQQWFGYKPLHT